MFKYRRVHFFASLDTAAADAGVSSHKEPASAGNIKFPYFIEGSPSILKLQKVAGSQRDNSAWLKNTKKWTLCIIKQVLSQKLLNVAKCRRSLLCKDYGIDVIGRDSAVGTATRYELDGSRI